MSGNNNATISFPGHHWETLWPSAFDNFQLDIVGFLAILGEASVSANAQVSALSRLIYLPRLIPAPQALLPPTRPVSLTATTKASVTSVHSGNVKAHVHHVASIVLDNQMQDFEVRCVHITKKQTKSESTTKLDVALRGVPSSSRAEGNRTQTQVKAKAAGPLTWVAILGCAEAIVLFICSIIFGDGMSLIATILLSLLTTIVGIANKWTLNLPRRPAGSLTPPADTVIRYPNGSFLVVKCEEAVARELFFAPEGIDYNIKNPTTYRLLSLVGTLMLMLGVIALANARLQLQFAWAGAYVLINAAYWVAAAVPAKNHWDLSCYELEELGVAGGPKNDNFTLALWKAIILTKDRKWCQKGEPAAPSTVVWDQWLVEAEERAKLVGTSIGPVENPIWNVKNPQGLTFHPQKGTLYEVPADWDAKKAWDNMTEEYNASGAAHPAHAV